MKQGAEKNNFINPLLQLTGHILSALHRLPGLRCQIACDRTLLLTDHLGHMLQVSEFQQEDRAKISIFQLVLGMFPDIGSPAQTVMLKENAILYGAVVVHQQFFQPLNPDIFMQKFLHGLQEADLPVRIPLPIQQLFRPMDGPDLLIRQTIGRRILLFFPSSLAKGIFIYQLFKIVIHC